VWGQDRLWLIEQEILRSGAQASPSAIDV